VLVAEVARLFIDAQMLLDGTLGGGGHSAALLEQGAAVVGLDRDPEAIAAARARLAEYEATGRFRAIRGNFASIHEIDTLRDRTFDGILLDLGISSHQIDSADRGFTFREGAPLDMRMGSDEGIDAGELLDTAEEHELMGIFREYADEPKAGRLAREIVRRRQNRPFRTSDDLVGAIRASLGSRSGPSDFARLFQALRIAVNDELAGLERALPVLRDRLRPGGLLAVITYHSGEDRIVKHAFREWSADCVCPPRVLRCDCRGRPLGELVMRKGVSPSPEETEANPRARSARLRAWRSAP
jgi:16S rRNA (cytosine1402-N4)-methyltransferase